jgi:Protein of unknown function (DUF3307)
LNLLALVLAGHFLGDWIVQTDWQAANKGRNWRAMAEHVLGYHLAMTVVLLLGPAGWHLSTAGYWTLIGASAASHALIDRRWPVVALLRLTRSPGFAEQAWGVLAVDQALHLAILSLLVAWVGS